MIMRPKKPSLNETIRANEKAIRGLCMMAGKPAPEGFDTPEVVRKTRAAPTKSDIPTEHEEQSAFVKWFHLQYPKVLIFAPPMAAVRDYKLAAYLKAEGMFAGIPDIHVPAWKLVIEFKRQKGGVISPEQAWCEGYYKSIGWWHYFAYGAEDAKQKLMAVPK